MRRRKRLNAAAALICLLGCGTVAGASAADPERPPTKCTPDSPERRGLEGCTILASRPLAGSAAKTLYWHLDRFDSLAAAQKAAGPDGVAAEAHGAAWLMTVEARHDGHHGGRHVAWMGPLSLPAADGYTVRTQSSLLIPGGRTPAHKHSGPEVFYVVSGLQCVETQSVGHRLLPGKHYVLPPDTLHRGRVLGSGPRRLLSLVLHDAARPPSVDLTEHPPLAPCG